MKLNMKLISLLLAALMLCGSLSSFSALTAFAAETEVTTPDTDTSTTTKEKTAIDYVGDDKEGILPLYFANPDEKLADMELRNKTGDYELYAQVLTGEVAVRNTKTGQVLFTNPYDAAASTGSKDTKYELMSQIIVNYLDNGNEKVFTSFEMAALREQIKVKNIKHGVRVEYTIGREQTRRLVPRVIVDASFQNILAQILEKNGGDTSARNYRHFNENYYTFLSLENCVSEAEKKALLNEYPVLEKYDIWVFDDAGSDAAANLNKAEEIIKSDTEYSFEDMEADHMLTDYVAEDENPPVFKMALEYTLDADGLSVRLPANGIRFNESLYQLSNITVLPYMGAGNSNYSGYTFYPDGSGALFSFEDLDIASVTTISSKVYGIDYAYQKLTGTYQETIRYPVFGVVEDTEYYDYRMFEDEAPTRLNGVMNELVKQNAGSNSNLALKVYESAMQDADMEMVTEKKGYMAIIEEGDALAEIQTYHAGMTGDYNSIKMLFNPRPSDSYNLADSISVGDNSEWTVVSSRKYVGNYKIRYTMLTDNELAADKGLASGSYYEATWLGMAFAYRDYLEKNGQLDRLTSEEVAGDIPLYIESFGALEATEKILSVPVDVMKPLTSFEDIKTMYEELSKRGVSNINFKLTGYAEGGMYASIPNKIDWENVVEKDLDFQALLDYAAGLENGELGLYPDFDFAYASEDTLFDGLSMRRHVVKTIDDRYASRREYSPTMQKYISYYELAVSPAYFDVFYEKLATDYQKKYDNLTGLSVGSLGNALNSDFDEDEPYNREDSKGFVVKALEYLSGQNDGKMEIMVDGGNAYTWSYVDHILGVSLDSSRYIKASYSVPFIGVVLHGYMNFTGTPLNMEGDVNYAMLKAIENGASIYFTLSYENTQELKDYYLLSQYYSIRYDIWKDDVVEIYNELNAEMKDVQDKLIVNHQFLDGTRVADTDELASDIRGEFNSVLEYQQNKAENERLEVLQAMANARENIANVESLAQTLIEVRLANYSGARGAATMYAATSEEGFYNALMAYVNAQNEWKRVLTAYEAATDEEKAVMKVSYDAAQDVMTSSYNQLKKSIRSVERIYAQLTEQYDDLNELLALAKGEKGAILINGTPDCPSSIKAEIEKQLANTEEMMERVLGIQINRSTSKLEMDTFLYAHVAQVFTALAEKNPDLSMSDLAQVTYEAISAGKVGLTEDDLDFLRYLDANKDKTDAELKAKYGIKSDSVEDVTGLVTFVKELLTGMDASDAGFDAKVQEIFDPAMTTAEIDDAIKAYYNSLVAGEANGLYMPSLKILSAKRLAVSAAETAAKNQIKKVTKGGNLKNLVKDSTMATYIDAVEAAILEQDGGYESSEVNRQIIETYIVTLYYQDYYKAIKADGVEKMMVTTTYTTQTSLKRLFQMRYTQMINDYKESEQGDMYLSLLEEILSDAEFLFSMDRITDKVASEEYGDVSASLLDGFVGLFAAGVLTKVKLAPTSDVADDIEPAIQAAVAEATSIADVKAIAAAYGDDANVLRLALYWYYQKVSTTTATYYYDAQMGTMDALVQADVAERVAAIRDQLPEDATKYDVWDAILTSLADTTDPLTAFVNSVAENITYADQAEMAEVIQQYYCSLVFAEFDDEYPLGNAPALPTLEDEDDLKLVIRTNAQAWAKSLAAKAKSLVARGEMPNYAMSTVCTAADVTAKAREYAAWYIDESYDEFDTLVAELEDYIRYWYYNNIKTDRLGLAINAADTNINFPVNDLYCDVYAAGQSVVDLMEYYTILFTDLTQEDLDDMAQKTEQTIEEEDDDFSKYSSDEGKLVAVTYGDKNADGTYSEYKTFLLNYNDFSVRVTYNGVEYTIPSYGYISLYA